MIHTHTQHHFVEPGKNLVLLLLLLLLTSTLTNTAYSRSWTNGKRSLLVLLFSASRTNGKKTSDYSSALFSSYSTRTWLRQRCWLYAIKFLLLYHTPLALYNCFTGKNPITFMHCPLYYRQANPIRTHNVISFMPGWGWAEKDTHLRVTLSMGTHPTMNSWRVIRQED